MKMSYSNYPAMQLISDMTTNIHSLGIVGNVREEHSNDPRLKAMVASAITDIHNYRDRYRNVMWITNPFCDAVANCQEKLEKLGLLELVDNQSGCILLGKQMLFYEVGANVDVVYSFIGNRLAGLFHNAIDYEKVFGTAHTISKFVYEKSLLRAIRLILTFKKFAKLEIKELKPKTKNHLFTCKYVNDTDFKVDIMNCTWFTTLVKSEGFKVRGHLRWQACGPNHSERELIYVHDFEKEGYTRQAKMLTDE